MMRIWVDTDFGFDDLWALLLLKHLHIAVDGVSLVAGNTPLYQVKRNAEASLGAFDFTWPVFAGADKPLQREPETAERILGEYGMQSRGEFLPYVAALNANDTNIANNTNNTNNTNNIQTTLGESAVGALVSWLSNKDTHHIIALGPLTNLAHLINKHPEHASKITQITWLGGSRGAGNHSQYAEYNALADPEALAVVARSQIPFRMIDLELCRQVSFGESDMPSMYGKNKQLIADLLGGYLDIAVHRGRTHMSIYDPLACLSVANNSLFKFVPASLAVHTQPDARYGQTVIDICSNENTDSFEIAINVDATHACKLCLSALTNA